MLLLLQNHLSKLKILKVWIEATVDEVEPPNARLKAKSALVYITFRLASCGIREDIERKAIVRRVISETGRLILLDVFTPFMNNDSSPYPWLSGDDSCRLFPPITDEVTKIPPLDHLFLLLVFVCLCYLTILFFWFNDCLISKYDTLSVFFLFSIKKILVLIIYYNPYIRSISFNSLSV